METPINRRKQLGKTIKAKRSKAGYTQRAFAPIAGTNQSYLWEIENGRVSVGVDVLCRIADALGITVNELIEF